MDCFGATDSGYFVSRMALLDWVNRTLKLDLCQIQQLSTGAVYCQLLDSLYPGHVQLSRINWKARLEHEFLQNFKMLQAAFDRLGIDKKIEVGGLVKGRYHDNLETIQWMKRYIELHGGPQAQYDPVARRGKITVELPAGKLKGRQGNKQNAKCIEGLKGAAKPDILATAHSFDLLPNYRPKILENSSLQNRKLSNVRSVDLMPKMNRKGSCHVKKGHIRMTSDVPLQLEAPRATLNYLATEVDEDPRIIRIFQILSEGVQEKVQIGRIRQLLGWKPPLFQEGDDI